MRNEEGFTFIELLIVILILALVAGGAVIAIGGADHQAQANNVQTFPTFFRAAQTQAMAKDNVCPGLLLFNTNPAAQGDPWLVTFSIPSPCPNFTSPIIPGPSYNLESSCNPGSPPPSGVQATCISLPAGSYLSPGSPQLPFGWWLSSQSAYDSANKKTLYSGPLLVIFNNGGSLNAPLLPQGTIYFTFNVSNGHPVSYTVYPLTGLIIQP